MAVKIVINVYDMDDSTDGKALALYVQRVASHLRDNSTGGTSSDVHSGAISYDWAATHDTGKDLRPIELQADDLVLYAMNTADWYDYHMRMARQNATRLEWRGHMITVTRRYYREFADAGRFDPRAIDRATDELRSAYKGRVGEEKAQQNQSC